MFATLPFSETTVADVSGHMHDFRIIDVREPPERTGPLGHIPNTELVPMQTVPQAMADWAKDEKILFVCRSGARSGKVCSWLAQQGFTNLHNLVGGMIAWNQTALPVTGRG